MAPAEGRSAIEMVFSAEKHYHLGKLNAERPPDLRTPRPDTDSLSQFVVGRYLPERNRSKYMTQWRREACCFMAFARLLFLPLGFPSVSARKERVSEFEFMALEEKGHCAINKVVIKWQ